MKRWAAIFAAEAACVLAVSCASSEPDNGPNEGDVGTDSSVDASSPSLGDAAIDADPADVDAGSPKARDVKCETDPCYVSVSGNGGHHMCGLLKDGTVRCWGRDTLEPPATPGERGDGALGRDAAVSVLAGATPAPVVGLSSVVQISVGPNLGACARTADGSVYCWGRNDAGQLGRPFTERTLAVPTRVEGIPPVKDVQLGHRLACAVAVERGSLYCWGIFPPDSRFAWDAYGIDAAQLTPFPPQAVTTIPGPLAALAIGTAGFPAMDTVIGLREDKVLVNIGPHVTGQTSVNPPWSGPVERSSVVGAWAFAYLSTDTQLWQWLPNNGEASSQKVFLPSTDLVVDVKVSAYSESQWQQVEQGGALLATGRLYRWGANAAGALGVDPNAKPSAEYPMEVAQLGDRVVSFATTLGAACASLVDGSVKCWGANAYGELGRGSVDLAAHPDPETIR
jgi:Regulator of chromosome condensation (RCC1) repeat